MTDRGSDWEQSKENIQPLRQGRKMSSLRAALAPRAGNQRHQQQQVFENELRTYEGDDPMSVWHKYIQWVEQNYPKGGNSGNFQQLITQCVSAFLEDERYHNDKRYIDVWLKYATYFTNTLEIYTYMYSRNIGCKLAIFFEHWAWELQQLGNIKKAYTILQEGLQRNAEPRKILLTAEKALQAKVIELCKDNNMFEDRMHEEDRSVLNSLKSVGKDKRAPIRRVGDVLLDEAVQLPVQVQHVSHQSKQPFQVFNDENAFPSQLPTGKGSRKCVQKEQQNKENDSKPGKWNGAGMKLKNVKQARATENKPGFTVHVDENDYAPAQPSQVQIPANGNVLSARKGHYSPPRTIFETPNPNAMPMYSKYKVYGGAEEFQFEEIRAARWLAKRKEEQRIEEETRQRAMEEEVQILKVELMKLKMQVSNSDTGSQFSSTSSGNHTPIEQEPQISSPVNYQVESEAFGHGKPIENKAICSQSSLYNNTCNATLQVQALWNVSLFHNSNPKVEFVDDQTGPSLPRNLPFKIHEDSKDENDDPKENVPPEEYVQSHCKRSLAGILQQSMNIPTQPLEQRDDDDSEDDDLGLCPLPSAQETSTAVVSPEQFNEDVVRQCASTPFMKAYVPPAEYDGFTSNLATAIISAVPNWAPSESATKEHLTEPRAQLTCATVPCMKPGIPRMSLGGQNILSPIMEGSREDRYKSSSSTSSSSGPHSNMTSNYYQITNYTAGKSVYVWPEPQIVNNNSKACNEDFIRPKTPGLNSVTLTSTNINPFCEELQKRLLKNLKNPVCQRCGYQLISKNMPKIGPESRLVIEDKTYTILEKLWKGANGAVYVYLAKENDDTFLNNVVLKVNKPANEWEFYISTELHQRLRSLSASCNVTQSVMLVEHVQIYKNKSILVSGYGKHGTLLDLVNQYSSTMPHRMPENVVLYLTLEMLQIVSQIHRCHIIHADIKPDNFVVVNMPCLAVTKDNEALDKTVCLRLIDFGQSIDMKLLPGGTTFTHTVQTSGFQCIEMKEQKPWTYQTDLYGLLGSIHVLIFPNYMEVRKNSDGHWELVQKFKRYWQKNFWDNLFHTLLNIPNCESIPDLQPFIETIQKKLGEPQCWKAFQAQCEQLMSVKRTK